MFSVVVFHRLVCHLEKLAFDYIRQSLGENFLANFVDSYVDNFLRTVSWTIFHFVDNLEDNFLDNFWDNLRDNFRDLSLFRVGLIPFNYRIVVLLIRKSTFCQKVTVHKDRKQSEKACMFF